MIPTFAGYQPRTRATRAAAISLILATHSVAIAAFILVGGVQYVIHRTEPMLVQLVSAPPPRPVEVPRPVPMPNMRPPEIRLDNPLPPENLYAVRMVENAAPSAPVIAAAPLASAPPSPVTPAPVVEPPRADMAYLNNPAPSYPAVSKRAGEQGRVMLRVRVDAKGEVEEVLVQATSGFPRLDAAALAAVRRWRFTPARMGERAVPGWALVPVHFTLRG